MGLFDFLFGSKPASTVEVVSDRIWMSQQAKFIGIRTELEERSGSDSVAVLLIAHFADTLERLDAIASESSGGSPVTATLAENLSLDIASGLNLDETATIDLIVAERHPLLEVDETLMQFAEELTCKCRVAHHLSLDDPLIDMFAGEWVQGMLKKLGMKEDEAIESNMVSRSIKDAQKKIAAQAVGNSEADSAAEWLEKNMPNAFEN